MTDLLLTRRTFLVAGLAPFFLPVRVHCDPGVDTTPINPLRTIADLDREINHVKGRPVQYNSKDVPAPRDIKELIQLLRIYKLRRALKGSNTGPLDSFDESIDRRYEEDLWKRVMKHLDINSQKQYGDFAPEKLPVLFLRELPRILAKYNIAIHWDIFNPSDTVPFFSATPIFFRVQSASVSRDKKESNVISVLYSNELNNETQPESRAAFGFCESGVIHVVDDSIRTAVAYWNSTINRSTVNVEDDAVIRGRQLIILRSYLRDPETVLENSPKLFIKHSALIFWKRAGSSSSAINVADADFRSHAKTHEDGHIQIGTTISDDAARANTLNEYIKIQERGAYLYAAAKAKDETTRLIALFDIFHKAAESQAAGADTEPSNFTLSCSEAARILVYQARKLGYAMDLFNEIDDAKDLTSEERFAVLTGVIATLPLNQLDRVCQEAFNQRMDAAKQIEQYDKKISSPSAGLLLGGGAAVVLLGGGYFVRERNKRREGSKPQMSRQKRRYLDRKERENKV